MKPKKYSKEEIAEINTDITKMIMRAKSGKKYILLFSKALYELLIKESDLIKIGNNGVARYLGIPIKVEYGDLLFANLVESIDIIYLGK